MKYSIKGRLTNTDETAVLNILNQYNLWHLDTDTNERDINRNPLFIFEAWVNTIEEKDSLFTSLKPFVDISGESIDWHECTHDEVNPQPCVIAESYPVSG